MNSNFPYRNLRDFLKQKGMLNANRKALDAMKLEYYKLYQRAFRERYAKTQLNLVIGKKQLTHLEEKSKHYAIKKTQYLIHLIQNDMKGNNMPPNLLIELEVAILETLDSLAKTMGSSPETRVKLLEVYTKIESLLTLLPC